MKKNKCSIFLNFGQDPERSYVVGSQSFQSSSHVGKVGDLYWDELRVEGDLKFPEIISPVRAFAQRFCPEVLDELTKDASTEKEGFTNE